MYTHKNKFQKYTSHIHLAIYQKEPEKAFEKEHAKEPEQEPPKNNTRKGIRKGTRTIAWKVS